MLSGQQCTTSIQQSAPDAIEACLHVRKSTCKMESEDYAKAIFQTAKMLLLRHLCNAARQQLCALWLWVCLWCHSWPSVWPALSLSTLAAKASWLCPTGDWQLSRSRACLRELSQADSLFSLTSEDKPPLSNHWHSSKHTQILHVTSYKIS